MLTTKLIDYFRAMGEKLGIVKSVWSIAEVTNFGEIPFPGATVVEYNGGWGKAGSVSIPAMATWADIWRACDKLIDDSGDHHHVFVEKVLPVQGKVDVLTFWTGS